MTLPRIIKSWQFNINQQVGSVSALPACNQSAMSAVKESFKNFISNPWLVWGSCWGHTSTPVFGNGDGIDNWMTAGVPTTAKLIWGTGNHSWMVLQQAGYGSNTALCIDLNDINSYNATIVLSPSVGFGVVNGGTNGSASARPTATDELILSSNAAWGGYNGTGTWRLHTMMASDGRSTRIAMMRNNASVGLWMIESVKNPISTWINPIVGVVVGNTTTSDAATYATLSTTNNTKGRIGNDVCSFYMTYEAYGSTSIPSIGISPDDDTGEWPIFPVGLVQGSSPKHRGRKGELFDLWWAPNWTATADTFPDDATRILIQHGDVILPWDGSVPWSYA